MERRAKLLWLIIFLSPAAGRDARAYRPFDGTDAAVAALGEFEAEIGCVWKAD